MASMYETNLVGKRQEILDDIFNVEAEATPFLSSLRTGSQPKQMLSTWVGEVYPDVASTGVLDGTAATTPTRVDRYLISGTAQHFRREWGVTTLAQVTETAGAGRDEAGVQMVKAMLLLKRQMEQQFLSADDAAAENGGTPWTARGVYSWLANSAQSNYPVPSALRPAAACAYTSTLSSFTESSMRTIMEAAYAARKSPATLDGFVDVNVKAVLDDFTNVHPVSSSTSQPRVVYQVRDNNQYKSMVDTLVFSTGTVRLQLSSFLYRTTSTGAAGAGKYGVFLDLNMWDVGYLQKPANTNLPIDGSGRKGFVDAIAVLRCKNPLGQGYIAAS